MIIQGLLDFFRDTVVNIFTSFGQATSGLDLQDAGTTIAGFTGSASHFLSLFILSSMWGGVITAWGVFVSVWGITAIVAIFARRGAPSK